MPANLENSEVATILKKVSFHYNSIEIQCQRIFKLYTVALISHVTEWNEVKVTQSCPTLCDSMDCIVYGILQARILEWVTFPFSKGSSQPRNRTGVSCIAGRFFTSWATREAQENWNGLLIPSPANLPNPGIKLGSPALQADSFPAEVPEKPESRLNCLLMCWFR